MPATFESFGIKFLYPDNWNVVARDELEGDQGVTLELPCGGFFTVERERAGEPVDQLIEAIARSIEQDYGEVEREEIEIEGGGLDDRAIDFRFYYLDLLIISRLVIVQSGDETYVVQMQAENRDFDSNELVFAALLQQIRG